jgi:hypothetical protein
MYRSYLSHRDEVLSTLEEKPEMDFRDKGNEEPVFAR